MCGHNIQAQHSGPVESELAIEIKKERKREGEKSRNFISAKLSW